MHWLNFLLFYALEIINNGCFTDVLWIMEYHLCVYVYTDDNLFIFIIFIASKKKIIMYFFLGLCFLLYMILCTHIFGVRNNRRSIKVKTIFFLFRNG